MPESTFEWPEDEDEEDDEDDECDKDEELEDLYLPGWPEARPKAKRSTRQMNFIVSFLSRCSEDLVDFSKALNVAVRLLIWNENSPLFISFWNMNAG